MADDYPADVYGIVTVGGTPTSGIIEIAADEDVFLVNLTAGVTYTFAVTRAVTAGLDDPYLALYSPTGSLLSFNDDLAHPTNTNAGLSFTAQVSGNHQLSVSNADVNAGTGAYLVSAVIAQPGLLAGTRFADTLTGGAIANTLLGYDGNDTLDGKAGNDSLVGALGNDTLVGGLGTDVMLGGLGNDSYWVDQLADQVVELAGEGTDTVNVQITAAGTVYVLAAEIEHAVIRSAAAIHLTGNTLANALTGNAAANILDGLGGNDTLSGAGGVDTLSGGLGVDTLNGGTGADTLTGGAGNDLYFIDDVLDQIIELAPAGQGVDSVRATLLAGSHYTLAPNVENASLLGTAAAHLTGNASNNVITGNAGANTLVGAGGADILNGGAGLDRLEGGAGADNFRFTVNVIAGNRDTVVDFSAVDDTLQLENAVFTKLGAPGTLSVDFFAANATGTAQDANDYILYRTADGALFYDSDGSGIAVKVQFATLLGAPTISAADIQVI